MEKVMLKDLKKGEWFTLKPIEEPKDCQVFVKGDYIRSDRRYECMRWSDIGSFRYFPGTKEVYVGFTF